MEEYTLEDVQNLLRTFQKTMQEKAQTVRAQWNLITCLETISQVQLARRMNVFGIRATNQLVAQLFYYLGFKFNSMKFSDFVNLMETSPESLGTKSRSISRGKDVLHETLRAYEDDYNKYCRRTQAYTATTSTRQSGAQDLTQKRTRKVARPYTAANGQQQTRMAKYGSQIASARRQKGSVKANRANDYHHEEEDVHCDNHCSQSNGGGDSGAFAYEPSRTCFERSLPRDLSSKKTREATLRSLSNTSIQRQDYDGIDSYKAIPQNNGMSMRELLKTITDVAYSAHPNTRTCFLKWRDPHHDLLDAEDLRSGLKHDNKIVISKAEAQKVIDKYGGPMNQSTFAMMLHDGSQFNTEAFIGDDI